MDSKETTANIGALSPDDIYIKVSVLCKLQAQVDAAKAELEPFLSPGESFSCDLGKLTKTKEVESTTYTAEGKRQKDAFAEQCIANGLAKKTLDKSQLRLTLIKK